MRVDTTTDRRAAISRRPGRRTASGWPTRKLLKSHWRASSSTRWTTGKKHADHRRHERRRSPVFDKSGKYLYFTASTDVGPPIEFGPATCAGAAGHAQRLRGGASKDDPSPLAPESDEEKTEDGKKKAEARRRTTQEGRDRKRPRSRCSEVDLDDHRPADPGPADAARNVRRPRRPARRGWSLASRKRRRSPDGGARLHGAPLRPGEARRPTWPSAGVKSFRTAGKRREVLYQQGEKLGDRRHSAHARVGIRARRRRRPAATRER